MADVRALLAAERHSRRISHPFLTYTKSGQLLCNVCHLNVKSEALWEGHLRSANHRKNAAKTVGEEKSTKSLKRKLDDVDEAEEDGPLPEDDARKKPKSRAVSHAEDIVNGQRKAPNEDEKPPVLKTVRFDVQEQPGEHSMPDMPATEPPPREDPFVVKELAPGDDEEMAAFEREIASLEEQPDYSAATITAAPMSAAQLDEQEREDKRRQQEVEAEDVIDEEGRKAEEEFEVMENLEERIKKLKERREALRSGENEGIVLDTSSKVPDPVNVSTEPVASKQDEDIEEEDDDDDVDDWYG